MYSSPNLPQTPNNLLFALRPNTTLCGICGAYYSNPNYYRRWRWSHEHASTHSERAHRLFAEYPHLFYPEAAQLLQHVAIPILDIVLSDEVAQALKEAPRPCITK
jgi:hypothetical protein